MVMGFLQHGFLSGYGTHGNAFEYRITVYRSTRDGRAPSRTGQLFWPDLPTVHLPKLATPTAPNAHSHFSTGRTMPRRMKRWARMNANSTGRVARTNPAKPDASLAICWNW